MKRPLTRRVLLSFFLTLAVASTGCKLAEPYLIPNKSIELWSSLQPDMRPRAQLPAIHEPDRKPVLVEYRALGLSDTEMTQAVARPARFYRVAAARQNPLLIIGGVVLGMALPHLALGLAVGLDKPTASEERAISDVAGGALALTLGGLHIAAGAILMIAGEHRPRVIPSEPQLLYQYIEPPASAPSDSESPNLSKISPLAAPVRF